MPKLIRFYIVNCIIGFALAAAFTGAILWLNVANLWHLISTSDIGLMAVIVFWILNGIVFAGAQCTVAILLMTEKEDEDDGPRGGRAVPVRVAAQSREAHGPVR
jgi:hypothetical protein